MDGDTGAHPPQARQAGTGCISGGPAVGLQTITGGMQVTGFNESPSPNYQSLKCPYRES